MNILDRALSVLLILGGLGHTLGSIKAYRADPMTLLWSLCASLFVFLLAGTNLVRSVQPSSALAWLCLVFGVCWIIASLRFGQLIGHVFDPRVLIFLAITLGLCAMSVRTLLKP